MAQPGPIKSLHTSFAIVDLVSDQGPTTAAAIGAELDAPSSTVHDHLQTLDHLGCLVKRGQEYKIGMRFQEIGERLRRRLPLFQAARPELEDLATETGEFAPLMIEEDGYGVLLYTAEGETADHISLRSTYPGARTKLHTTATGKAILANMPEDRVSEIIDRHGLTEQTEDTVVDRETLMADLETAAERGYAVEYGERVRGLFSLGAPIMKDGNQLMGSIGLFGLIRQDESEIEERLAQQLLEVADVIEINLSY